MKLMIQVTIVFALIGVAVGYTFTELNQFNTRVNQVLAP